MTISIHALVKRATLKDCLSTAADDYISIHALVKRATLTLLSMSYP